MQKRNAVASSSSSSVVVIGNDDDATSDALSGPIAKCIASTLRTQAAIDALGKKGGHEWVV